MADGSDAIAGVLVCPEEIFGQVTWDEAEGHALTQRRTSRKNYRFATGEGIWHCSFCPENHVCEEFEYEFDYFNTLESPGPWLGGRLEMNFALFAIFIAAAALAWWLSGYDGQVTGENKREDLIRRGVRCGASTLLVAMGCLNGYLMIFMIVAIAVLWASCVSELFARGFHIFVDSPDSREFDPKQATRELNRLSALVRDGRNEEAIALCHRLLDMPGVSAMAIETMLLHLYREKYSDDVVAAMPEFAEVRALREQGRCAEAVRLLGRSLENNSRNFPAALLLMRIYAQDLQKSSRARLVIQKFGQAELPPGFAGFANERINAWGRGVSVESKSSEGIESMLVYRSSPSDSRSPLEANSASLDELLAAGHLSTAIEVLESRIQAAPNDFESRLKLAEAHGVYCGNWLTAGKIVEKIVASRAFSPEQIQTARAKLAAWKAVPSEKRICLGA